MNILHCAALLEKRQFSQELAPEQAPTPALPQKTAELKEKLFAWTMPPAWRGETQRTFFGKQIGEESEDACVGQRRRRCQAIRRAVKSAP